jgi:hypothetical protein
MKIKALLTIVVDGVLIQAGESAIVDDITGNELIALGHAIALPEDERGGFAVPMEVTPEA